MKKAFILDWDGTATDNYRRSEAVFNPMVDLFSSRYGIPKEKLVNMFLDESKNIRNNERQHPWIHKGHLAAYCEDPLIYNNSAFVGVLNSLRGGEVSSLWQEVLLAYSGAYRLSSPVYVHKLPEVIDYLKEQGSVVVVTNSDSQKVREEISALSLGVGVVGYAKKYKITPELTDVPCLMKARDGRSVNLRRGFYFSILENFDPDTSFVIGDGFSCDLALPMTLGFGVTLVSDFWSMDWARLKVEEYSRGTSISKLSDILQMEG